MSDDAIRVTVATRDACITYTDHEKGWQLGWQGPAKGGVYSPLAFREAKWVLGQWEKHASFSKEGFAGVLEGIKKMYNGKSFTLTLAGLLPKPTVDLVLDYKVTQFGILHPMFASVQFTTEELDKFTIEDETISVSEATIFLKAMQIQDGVFDGVQ